MATPNNLLAENYLPYVTTNGGYRTAKPVYIDSDLTVTGTTTIVGVTLTDLTTTGNTTLGNAVTDTTLVNGVLTVTATATGVGITSSAGLALKSGTAAPASAGALAAGAPIALFSNGIGIYVTSDAPAFSSVKGSICIALDGSSSSTRLFINNGTTNWVAVTTAS